MKYISLFMGVMLVISSSVMANDRVVYPIVPKPNQLQPRSGYFILNARTIFVANRPDELSTARFFKKLIGPATGYVPQIKDRVAQKKNVIIFSITDKVSQDEGYRLTVRPDYILLQAKTAAGLFYAMQSLRQLLPVQIESSFPYNNLKWSVPAVDITDAPRFPYRGMQLDVARSFFSVDFIKKYIDLIAFHKMNRFHWHLTDNQGWRIEIKKYPKLTSVGSIRRETIVGHTLDKDPLYDGKPYKGYYTQDEIRDVVRYAAARHVEVIPEIDIPGHATAMVAAYPELSCVPGPFEVTRSYGIFPEILCPTEYTFNFLDDVFREVAALFPSPYIHIGGDEVLKTQWQNCAVCKKVMIKNNLKNLNELQSYFVRRVATIVGKYGRKIIGWDEILADGVSPNAVIMSWRGMSGGIEAAKNGHDAIMTPSTHTYFDQYQSLSLDEPMSIHGFTDLKEVYAFNPVPKSLNAQEAHHIKGAQGNVWTEYIHDPARVEYAILPRMSALAEVLWTAPEHHNYQDFLTRISLLFKRFDQMGLNAARSLYKVVAKGRLMPDNRMKVTLKVEGDDMAILYTVDGSKPEANARIYDKPLLFDHSVVVRAVGKNTITGQLFGDTRLSFEHHKGLGKKIKFSHIPTVTGKEKAEEILLDGLLARDRIFQAREWAVVTGTDFEAVIDLEKDTIVRQVTVGVDAGQYRQLYPPRRFEVLLSHDGQKWQSGGIMTAQDIATAGVALSLSFAPTKARYVKVILTNAGEVFSAQYQTMKPTSLYIDEISIH